ncbi:glycogen debranching enzyme [Cavenderia fasciculata]|uniref:Glycogen debranching enzyme n=1 Tax=Cavenderia fasciculata TaxID=261658 RepID=F4PRV5_CACFS|nr:glycogen debranching enzyme [Cavenderia fasciculata]EGG21391.1 glycogen debranching enzyme [Cavenderia fasciculata]|eukprot:XP_004359241.1 glycogen debranching enzyme [Cavenderia fasciculata]
MIEPDLLNKNNNSSSSNTKSNNNNSNSNNNNNVNNSMKSLNINNNNESQQQQQSLSANQQIYSITLTGNGSEPPFSAKGMVLDELGVLRIIIPSGLEVAASNPIIYSNYPNNPTDTFKRDQFAPFQTGNIKHEYYGNNDLIFEKKIERYGCFDYYVEWTDRMGKTVKKGTIGTFQINTTLLINAKEVSGDGIVMQTVLTKCMGAIDQWESHINMIDLVWNHTANNSHWLKDHPEAGYNIDNSPHLKAAITLDDAFMEFSEKNVGMHVESAEELELLVAKIKDHVIAPLKLWEFYVLDIEKELDIFSSAYPASVPPVDPNQPPASPYLPMSPKNMNESAYLVDNIFKKGMVRDPTYDRYSMHIDLNHTFQLLNNTASFKPLTLIEKKQKYEDYLRLVNLTLYREYDTDLAAIVQNITERIKYERIAPHGPKLGEVSTRHPLIDSYFTKVDHRQADGSQRKLHLANNGWIFNYNPAIDFASKDSKAYLRRDVIIWGDCVKMRYGSAPADNPWLWDHMRQYTERMASIFHAIRIDNCHSTPIHVAQYLLDIARAVRPSIYVTCELFTGSEDADSVFVKRLGINSLIREAMVAHDSSELGRVCHRYGGRPICSFESIPPSSNDNNAINFTNNQIGVKSLKPTLPPALFMDCTHDNQTPAQKRTIKDTLPNAAIVAMTVSAIGSTRGYDEIYPHTIDLVNEKRIYQVQNDINNGIQPLKSLLNNLHLELSNNKYTEVHIHQEHNVILVQRFSPSLNKSIFLLAHTCFSEQKPEDIKLPDVIQIPCKLTEFICGANITNSYQDHWNRDQNYLTGVHLDVDTRYGDRVYEKYCYVESEYNLHHNLHLKLKEFPPGSILLFRGEIPKECNQAINQLNGVLEERKKLEQTLEKVSLIDLNILIFRHHDEEKAVGGGGYNVANFGFLPYCGLQGFATILNQVSEWNDLGHPLCNNIREGDWAMDYIVQRLLVSGRNNLQGIAKWLADCFVLVKRLPRHFIPKYFHQVVTIAYRAAVDKAITLMSPFVNSRESSWFVRALALSSLEFYGTVTPLIAHHPEVTDPFGPDGNASMAAGLPHFCAGYMRAWGRDTFISLRGLMLTTGRLDEAKQLIIGFASSLRFGLIPNLLDSGTRPRYNSRDSVWWWIKSVQDYCEMGGEVRANDMLNYRVFRIFPNDQSSPYSTVHDILHEIMQSHARGIHFREPHAGREIDDRMKDEGFNVDIDINPATGFLYGGNLYNCGTWMDKMGESTKARNYGDPATPRDGAPIEITAMVYVTAKWLAAINKTGQFKYASVKLGADEKIEWTYSQWADTIKANFEKQYYIPSSSDDKKYNINSSFVRRRYIYKDTVGSKNSYSDYQFRPNQLVAMAFAPELFTRDYVLRTLDITKQSLIGPLGVRTLDPNDTDYHANYNNSLDNDYRPTAKGFNYHNGPEWLWLYGFFLESLVKFNHLYPSTPNQSLSPSPIPSPLIISPSSSLISMTHLVESFLQRHKSYILQSSYFSLPELTNRDGAHCRDGCDAQAWSIATLLASLNVLFQQKQQIHH